MPELGDKEFHVSWIDGAKGRALARKRGMEADGSFWDYVQEHEVEASRRFPNLALAKGWGKRYGVGLDDFGHPVIEVHQYGASDGDCPGWDLVERWEWQDNDWIDVGK